MRLSETSIEQHAREKIVGLFQKSQDGALQIHLRCSNAYRDGRMVVAVVKGRPLDSPSPPLNRRG
jgi:hypothetical protein